MGGVSMLFSVGDESGDLHASNLMREIHALEPGVSFAGVGMQRMREAGLEALEKEDETGGAMWLHNLVQLGKFRLRLRLFRRAFRERRPDLVVLVDYGGFNMFLARAATEAGIPVLYYILPQVWAHGRYRLKKIKKWVSKAVVIYPFEPELCRSYGVETEYVGHPLFDELERRPPSSRKVTQLQAPGGQLVGLFPGSRRQEIRANLPVMLEAGARICREMPQVRFAAVCPGSVRPTVQQMVREGGLEVGFPDVRPVELARAARMSITKSGTITLELASQRCPMVIFYRLNAFLYFFAKGVAQTRYIGIVNALADREICPEKPMWRPEPSWVARQALALLKDGEFFQNCRSDLARVMRDFAVPGASRRAAQVAVRMARAGR